MWANAQSDGHPAAIGGALCSMPQSLADAQYQSVMLPRRETRLN